LEGQGAGLDPRPQDQRAVQGCHCEIGHFEVIVAEEQEHQRTTYPVLLAGFSNSLANNMLYFSPCLFSMGISFNPSNIASEGERISSHSSQIMTVDSM
jgi:hypothetical protein